MESVNSLNIEGNIQDCHGWTNPVLFGRILGSALVSNVKNCMSEFKPRFWRCYMACLTSIISPSSSCGIYKTLCVLIVLDWLRLLNSGLEPLLALLDVVYTWSVWSIKSLLYYSAVHLLKYSSISSKTKARAAVKHDIHLIRQIAN